MSQAPLKVKVLADQAGTKWIGYYGNRRRQAGEIFVLDDPKHFSKKWMEPIGWTPEGYEKPEAKTSAKPGQAPRTPLLKEQQPAEVAAAAKDEEQDGI